MAKQIDERIRTAIANMPYGGGILTRDGRKQSRSHLHPLNLSDVADYLEKLRAKLEYAAETDIKNEQELQERRAEDRAIARLVGRFTKA